MLRTVELVAFNSQQHKQIIFIAKSLGYKIHAALVYSKTNERYKYIMKHTLYC
jgi:hypothetical protein